MHRCDSVSCLSLSVRKLGDGVKVYSKRIGSTLLVALTCIGAVASVDVSKIGDDIRVDATRLCDDIHLAVRASEPMALSTSCMGEMSVDVSTASKPMELDANSVVHALRMVAAPISESLPMQAKKATGKLRLTCSVVCSVDKETTHWMWDAGEILLWDNNEMISI